MGLLFPFWNGSQEDLSKATAQLSARFRVLFDHARVPSMTEHDLSNQREPGHWHDTHTAIGPLHQYTVIGLRHDVSVGAFQTPAKRTIGALARPYPDVGSPNRPFMNEGMPMATSLRGA